MNKPKVTKNDPNPIPFIKIKNELKINEEGTLSSQNISSNSNESVHQNTQYQPAIPNIENQIETLPAGMNNARSSIYQREVKQEELLETEILLTNRVEILTSEKEHLRVDNETKKTRKNELKIRNKEKNEFLIEKSQKINHLKQNIENLKAKLKDKRESSEQTSKKKRVSLSFVFKFSFINLFAINLFQKLKSSRSFKRSGKKKQLSGNEKIKSADIEGIIFIILN